MTTIRMHRPIRMFWAYWSVAAAFLACSPAQAQSDYRLDIGDVLEISVAGIPELRQRVPIQVDRTISFPLLGTLTVAGLPISEARNKIQTALASKVFRQRAADGRESVIVIEADQITAIVVEFRPIYVNGDVSRPGELPYRPSMTVRQAVTLAGGYDVMRFRMNNPFLESADLRSTYETLWTEFAQGQARIWRLKTELGDAGLSQKKLVLDAPLPPSVIAQIIRVETEHLEGRQADMQREKAFIQRSMQQAEEQITVLEQQQQKEDEGTQADVQELRKVTELYGRGALPSPRVTDARRAVLWSSTRALQTTAQLMQVRKQRQDLTRQIERLGDQRKIDLLRELQEADGRLAETKARLQGTGEKLQYTSLVKSQLVRGSGGAPEIAIVRKSDGKRERFSADEDSELQPGDVVEVALRQPTPEVPAQ